MDLLLPERMDKPRSFCGCKAARDATSLPAALELAQPLGALYSGL
jgi:hypothetical protein